MNPKRAQVMAVLEDVTAAVSALPRPAMLRLWPVLVQAQAEVTQDLAAWARLHPAGATFTAQRYRSAIVGMDAALKRIAELEPAMALGLKEAGRASGTMAIAHLRRELEAFSTIFDGTTQTLAIDTAAVIAQGERVLIRKFASSARRYAGWVGETVINELAVGRVRGETMFELTDRLQKRLPHVFREQRSRAWMVARTETMEAYAQVHHDGVAAAAAEDPGLLCRWDSSFDMRRCPMCASLDGQVVDTVAGEEFVARWYTTTKKGPPKLHVKRLPRPVAHPQCRCVATLWRAEWSRYMRRGAPGGNEIAASVAA